MKTKGFTLIELMIVIAIIAIIAAIAIPNMLSARLNSNETAAIATLRTIMSSQAMFQQTGKADENGNGQGEYGMFGELAGTVNVRGTSANLKPAVLSAFFGNLPNGVATRSGYHFAIFLPDLTKQGIWEAPGGGVSAPVDADQSEVLWSCYAWPVAHGKSGNRSFFIGHNGEILSTEGVYNGSTQPGFGAALKAGETDMGDELAFGTTGVDGNFWKQQG